MDEDDRTVIGTEVLHRVHTYLVRHVHLVLVVLLTYVTVGGLWQATNRPFWFDEIFTVTIARLESMSDVMGALRGAADTSAPGFYVIERALAGLVPHERIGYRLGSMLAVPMASLCLFFFARRDTDPVSALIAAAIPLLTVLYATYSIEARPYALMACALAFAAVAWQRASEPFWTVAFAVSLAVAVSIHYYAVLVLVPFAAAEATLYFADRQFRPRVWLALVAGGLTLAVYWPLLRGLRQYYGPHYWAKASVFRALASYDEYLSLMTVGAMAGVAGVLSVAMVVCAVRNVKAGARDTPGFVPPANCVLALGLLGLPWLALVAGRVAGGGVAARYTIGAALGLGLAGSYVSHWLGRRAAAVILVCILSAFGSKELVFWGAEWYGRNARSNDLTRFDRFLAPAAETLPIVVSNTLEFVPLAYYGSPALARRLVTLIDLPATREQTGTDSLELDVLVLQHYLPIRVEQYSEFAAAHEKFLLYASPGHGEWWLSRLLADGYSLNLLATGGSGALYAVARAGSRVPAF